MTLAIATRNDIRDVLTMMANDGPLSPERVLDYARPQDSALHGCFEWDDSAAAEGFRLVQAGALIRRIKIDVVVQSRNPTRVKLRAFVSQPSLRGESGGSYVSIEKSDQEDFKKEILVQLRNIRSRYSHHKDFESVWVAIDDALDRFSTVRL